VLELIEEARAAGSAIIAVFHDDAERRRACSREIALG
jgi:alpha-D-ribose 1-methylphosphonate 5-triphosphate synthase subunit PhnL